MCDVVWDASHELNKYVWGGQGALCSYDMMNLDLKYEIWLWSRITKDMYIDFLVESDATLAL